MVSEPRVPYEDDPRNEWGQKEWYDETVRLGQEIERLSAENERLREILVDIRTLIIKDSDKTVTTTGKQNMLTQIFHWCGRYDYIKSTQSQQSDKGEPQ
jgi:hypothetical protein